MCKKNYYELIEDTVIYVLQQVNGKEQEFRSTMSNEILGLIADFISGTAQLRDSWTENSHSLFYYRMYHHTRAYVNYRIFQEEAIPSSFLQVMKRAIFWLDEISSSDFVKCTGTIEDFTEWGYDHLEHKFACLLLNLAMVEVMEDYCGNHLCDPKQLADDLSTVITLLSSYSVPFTGRSDFKVRLKWVYRLTMLSRQWLPATWVPTSSDWDVFRQNGYWDYGHHVRNWED